MTFISRTTAKGYFSSRCIPTEAQFSNLLDSVKWYNESSVGGLDSVLSMGNITSRTQIFAHNAVNSVIRYITPNNFGTVYSGHGEAGRFMEVIGRADDVNSSGRPNYGLNFGYNISAGGGRENPNEASMAIQFESHFETGGDKLELHIPQVIDYAGGIHRMQSWTINKNDGTNTVYFTTSGFDFRDPLISLPEPFFSSAVSGVTKIHSNMTPRLDIEKYGNAYFRLEPVDGEVFYNNLSGGGHIFRNYLSQIQFRLYNTGEIYNLGLNDNTNIPKIVTAKNGILSVGSTVPVSPSNYPVYADEAAATTAGLAQHTLYKTATGEVRIKL